MPVTIKRVRSHYRVIDAETGNPAVTSKGTPIDGGGHMHAVQAENQARAINASLQKRSKIK